jgi:hypothetical protein
MGISVVKAKDSDPVGVNEHHVGRKRGVEQMGNVSLWWEDVMVNST